MNGVVGSGTIFYVAYLASKMPIKSPAQFHMPLKARGSPAEHSHLTGNDLVCRDAEAKETVAYFRSVMTPQTKEGKLEVSCKVRQQSFERHPIHVHLSWRCLTLRGSSCRLMRGSKMCSWSHALPTGVHAVNTQPTCQRAFIMLLTNVLFNSVCYREWTIRRAMVLFGDQYYNQSVSV